MPFVGLHGEPLVVLASRALRAAGVALLGADGESVRSAGATLVVHDPLCPATPVEFVREVLRVAESRGRAAVGVRPVTDTLKTSRRDAAPATVLVGETVDRTTLLAVCSPLALPYAVLSELGDWPDPADCAGLGDLAVLVDLLGRDRPVEQVPAPASARRVADESDVRLLEVLTGPWLPSEQE
ncbi:MAG: 2-C-methyl-D-erythritol 4-phosphate cytidylyltransferase [Nocardioidaceae bacterium]